MKCQFYFLSYIDDILVVCGCILCKFFNIYFHEQMFFQIFLTKGGARQLFLEVIAYALN